MAVRDQRADPNEVHGPANPAAPSVRTRPPPAPHRAPLILLIAEICPDGTCRPAIGDAFTYGGDHLTAAFPRTLQPWIERGLLRAGVSPPSPGHGRRTG
jgi:hypothetical protein